jgi:hypothetical protein
MGIKHIDELIFEPEKLRVVIDGIVGKKFPTYLKWDGNPSFVTGVDENGFFLAFKNGYHRKEKKLFRTEAQLKQEIIDQNLRHKMVLLFLSFSNFYEKTKESRTLGGDLIFTCFDDLYATPNTIRYTLNVDAWDTWDKLVGVAIHTVDGHISDFVSDYPNIEWIPTRPDIEYACLSDFSILDVPNSSKSEQTKFFKWVNTNLREFQKLKNYDNLCMYNRSFSNQSHYRNVIDFLEELWGWKQYLLDSLNVRYFDVIPYYNQKHEGLVIDTPYGLYKIVDRRMFSSLNFINHKKTLRNEAWNRLTTPLKKIANELLNI